jgi:hypothetical protein
VKILIDQSAIAERFSMNPPIKSHEMKREKKNARTLLLAINKKTDTKRTRSFRRESFLCFVVSVSAVKWIMKYEITKTAMKMK